MTSLARPVSELMQREVVTLQAGDRLDLADDIMRLGRIRHLPVLDDERLVGILSSRDLLAASLSRALDFEPAHRRAFMRAVDVKEVMSEDLDTISPNDDASDAGRRMMRHKIGCLPVVNENGALVGLLTETDLVRAALGMEPEGQEVKVASDAEGPSRFDRELEELRRVRDELRLQVHLGKSEATDLWEKLERRFGEAEAQARSLARRAEEPVQEVAEAARSLVEEIRSGYRKLRELL